MFESEWSRIFSENLREIMEEQGYSQRDLADATGIGESTIHYYITGRCIPSMRGIINMAYELDQDIDDFIDFGDDIQ